VAILPFIEQAPLYERYDFSQPWDGPNNLALHGVELDAYRCPGDVGLAPSETSYVMIVGKGTLGGEAKETVSFGDVTDGTSNTILAVEVAGLGIRWMEPLDMTVDEAVDYITAPAAGGQKHVHPGGVNVLFADGSVRSLDPSISPQTLRLLLTRDDGQPVPDF
jgi:prepilin-type processing-associated H-X9-DG protein